MGQKKRDRLNRIGTQNRQNRRSIIGQAEQNTMLRDCQNKTSRTGQAEQNRKSRIGQAEQVR
jgi:hypothetical protein